MEEKTLKDMVPHYAWYFVLHFNDTDRWELYESLGHNRRESLGKLTVEQFWALFEAAAKKALENK
jgi:hypothetical protein